MEKQHFMIYGSYGYTGQLIASLACRREMKPILAGRNEKKLQQQAQQLQLDYRVFDLNDTTATEKALGNIAAVIHCAGPFIHTYQAMAQACIRTRTHYLDITGEVDVIKGIMAMNDQALAANIMLMPGGGFDVVPSDCLAYYLKEKMPDANQLILAISAMSDQSHKLMVSRGTLRTMMKGIMEPTYIRDQGKLIPISSDIQARAFPFGKDTTLMCQPISWGDLVSAWWSTKIPHIETYMAAPNWVAPLSKLRNFIKPLLQTWPITNLIDWQINRLPEGPSEEHRRTSQSRIYGEVSNAAGKRIAALLKTPDGYGMTAETTLLLVNKILNGQARPGFQTPASAYGSGLVLEIHGVQREDFDVN